MYRFTVFLLTLLTILVLFVILVLYAEKPPVLFERWPIVMGKSPIHGRGMFATRDIKKSQTIEVAPMIIYERDEIRGDAPLRDYPISYGDGKAAIMLGYGSIYNHSDFNNAKWVFDSDDNLVVYAIKDIAAGEEIFVDYGQPYWQKRKQATETSKKPADPVPEEHPPEPQSDQCQSECP